MDVTLDDITVIRIKLNNDELQDLVSGERIVIDLDAALQIEIFYFSALNGNENPYHNKGINGETNGD